MAVQDENLTRMTESSQIICVNWNDSAKETGYADEAEKMEEIFRILLKIKLFTIE